MEDMRLLRIRQGKELEGWELLNNRAKTKTDTTVRPKKKKEIEDSEYVPCSPSYLGG